ncbi:hypothetical protein ACA910_001350 [Epithemia clementina (nom. ined.)]
MKRCTNNQWLYTSPAALAYSGNGNFHLWKYKTNLRLSTPTRTKKPLLRTSSSSHLCAVVLKNRRQFWEDAQQKAFSSSSLIAAVVVGTTIGGSSLCHAATAVSANEAGPSLAGEAFTTTPPLPVEPNVPFVYSPQWTGTRLPWLSLADAVQDDHVVQIQVRRSNKNKITSKRNNVQEQQVTTWQMARWPDPILRRSADPVPTSWLGTDELQRACQLLKRTARVNGAVGLAAQQCGVNARIVYLQQPPSTERKIHHPNDDDDDDVNNGDLIMVNPRIIERSPELDMRIWREECLVLPPTFRATVLRDDWVDVEYWEPTTETTADFFGSSSPSRSCQQLRLTGVMARAFQHEYDHDRGILITDHVSLDELENNIMRSIERPGHESRMQVAYARHLDAPLLIS